MDRWSEAARSSRCGEHRRFWVRAPHRREPRSAASRFPSSTAATAGCFFLPCIRGARWHPEELTRKAAAATIYACKQSGLMPDSELERSERQADRAGASNAKRAEKR